MDFKQFTAIAQGLTINDGTTSASMPSPLSTYNKVKGATSKEFTQCMDAKLKAGDLLVPKLRDAGYVSRCGRPGLKLQPPFTLPFDADGAFKFLVYQREASDLGGGRFLNRDLMSLTAHPSESEPPSPASAPPSPSQPPGADMAAAFSYIAALDSNFKYELVSGELLHVSSRQDDLATSRLVLPGFVGAMQQKLKCTAKDCLVVVPFATNEIYATRSSSPLGCCMLGDFSAAPSARHEVPEYLTSTPFRVARVDTSAPAQQLLERGVAPVLWERYPYHGQKPLHACADSRGQVLFSVPGSTAQAEEFMADLKAGVKPCIVAPAIDDGTPGKATGSCSGCMAFGVHSKCSRCRQACYCSKACQAAHWPQHKLQCKKK